MSDDHGGTGAGHPATGLLARLRGSELADDVLAWHDCHLDRAGHADEVPLELASSEPLAGLATTGGGESFHLCGGDERRPVFFYDDADSVLVLGRDLAEAVELLIGVHYFMDTVSALAEGVDAAVEWHEKLVRETLAQSEPGEPAYRARERAYLRTRQETQLQVAEELGVRALPLPDLLHRLRETAEAVAPDLEVLWVDGGEVNPIPHALEPEA
ncbi:hypothetical protein ACFXKD_00905 [Nocardiopsis aegyptia]|uniref:hypothetical protein n=1 Tax=Nocardiopsis aegyptia TaxID=220378 RepID=UPI00366A6AD9